jgi:hypothetical protein
MCTGLIIDWLIRRTSSLGTGGGGWGSTCSSDNLTYFFVK